MLGVDIKQHLTQRFEFLQGCGAAINKSPRSAVPGHDAAKNALIAIDELAFSQPGQCLGVVLQVEDSVDLSFCSAGCNQGAVCPITQGQPKRPKQNGLTCTGFACNDAHTCIEFQLQLVNQG